eukprot:103697-Amphidinium_carterae.2
MVSSILGRSSVSRSTVSQTRLDVYRFAMRACRFSHANSSSEAGEGHTSLLAAWKLACASTCSERALGGRRIAVQAGLDERARLRISNFS